MVAEPLAVWHAEHVNFAGLLDLLERQVVAFGDGARPNYDLMVDIVYYLRAYSDCVHHPREDVAFERLGARELAMNATISRLRQEHRVIATAGEELLWRLNEATGDVVSPRSALEAAAATYLSYYRQHLNTEERDVMPRAAKLLTAEDWLAVAAAVPPVADPLFGEHVEVRFTELRRQIAEQTAPVRDASQSR